VNSEVLSEST